MHLDIYTNLIRDSIARSRVIMLTLLVTVLTVFSLLDEEINDNYIFLDSHLKNLIQTRELFDTEMSIFKGTKGTDVLFSTCRVPDYRNRDISFNYFWTVNCKLKLEEYRHVIQQFLAQQSRKGPTVDSLTNRLTSIRRIGLNVKEQLETAKMSTFLSISDIAKAINDRKKYITVFNIKIRRSIAVLSLAAFSLALQLALLSNILLLFRTVKKGCKAATAFIPFHPNMLGFFIYIIWLLGCVCVTYLAFIYTVEGHLGTGFALSSFPLLLINLYFSFRTCTNIYHHGQHCDCCIVQPQSTP